MKFVLLAAAAVVSMGSVAFAGEMGDSWDRDTILEVAGQRSPHAKKASVEYGGQTASTATYCADRPERCAYGAAHKVKPMKLRVKLHSTAAGCSNAGDETSRPVYAEVDGVVVFAGYECVQDNRGGGNGG